MKIPVYQIQQHITEITNHDQERFIPGTQGWFNIRKPMNIKYYTKRIKGKKKLTISTDAEKEFDATEHLFLKKKKKLSIN